MSDLETDTNLLFGVIALQSDLIDMQQFVDACTIWSSRKSASLADVLIQQGWLLDEDAKHVNYLLSRRLQKGKRTARQMLTAIPDAMKVALAKEAKGDEEAKGDGGLLKMTPSIVARAPITAACIVMFMAGGS